MRSTLIAGLDIGTARTCAVIARHPGDGSRRPELKILGVGQTRTEGVRGDSIAHIDETTESVRRAVKEAELMAGAQVDRVWASLSAAQIEASGSVGVVAIGGDEVGPKDLDRVHEVARAVALPADRELLHAIPQEYVVDNRRGIHDPLGILGTRLEADVYLVSAHSPAVESVRKAVTRAGYRLEGVVAAPLAAARAVLSEDEKEVGVAMIEIGGATTELAVYHEGMIRHLAFLPFGGNTLTTDLVKGLSLPFAEAQRAKESYGCAQASLVDPRQTVEVPGPAPGQTRTVTRELIAHLLEQRLHEMFGIVLEELEDHGLTGALGAGTVLTGGTAALEGLAVVAQQSLGMAARIGVPAEGLGGLADAVARPRFSTAAGLVLYGGDRFAETGQGASKIGSGLLSQIAAWWKEFF